MITVSDGYALRAASTIQDTIYILAIPSLSAYFSTGPVKGLTTTGQIVARPSLVPTQVSPLSATASAGSVSVDVLDVDGYVTGLRRSAPMRGQSATLYIGYRDLPWADYLAALPGRISGFDRDATGLSYRIEVADTLDRVDVPVFKEEDVAAEPWTGGDKSFDSGSLVIRDSDGDSVYDTVLVGGTVGANPLDLLLKLLLSGGGNGGGYDVWPVWAGAGLTIDDVDVDWIEAERDNILTVNEQFIYRGEVSAKSFLEEDVCLPLGGYPLVSGTGKLRVQFVNSPGSLSPVLAVTSATILPRSLKWSDPADNYMSHVIFEFDDDGDGPQTTLKRASPQFLAATYDEIREHPISSKGLQTALGGAGIADAVADALFSRYGDPAPRVKFSTFFSRHLAEAGDVISLVTDQMPDWDGRGIGSTRLMLCLSVKAGPQKVDFDCLDLTAALTAGERAIIAPNGQADWTAASDAEKVYAYIASDVTEEMSDGEPAYVWS